VRPATGTDAACSKVTLLGFTTNLDSEAHAYSARAARHAPNTSLPDLNWVTFLPTASTWPDTSTPSRPLLGLHSPVIRRRGSGPRMRCPSTGLSEAARTLIRTSLSAGTGFSTSAIWTTSGGPYLV